MVRMDGTDIMIEVALTAIEYNEFVFDDVTKQAVSAKDAHNAYDLLLALTPDGPTEPKDLTAQEIQHGEAVGRHVWPGRVQVVPAHTYRFSAIELDLLIGLLERATSRHPILVLPDFLTIIKKLHGARDEYRKTVGWPQADPEPGD